MIQSQEVALRCSASLPGCFRRLHKFLLEEFNPKRIGRGASVLQLLDCKDDAARRLITGRSL